MANSILPLTALMPSGCINLENICSPSPTWPARLNHCVAKVIMSSHSKIILSPSKSLVAMRSLPSRPYVPSISISILLRCANTQFTLWGLPLYTVPSLLIPTQHLQQLASTQQYSPQPLCLRPSFEPYIPTNKGTQPHQGRRSDLV